MTNTSKAWLREFHNDPYVKRAQREGYPSRAAYKLLEIQDKDHLLRPGMRVLDIGAAPGSWSKIARKLVGASGRVIALDLLPLRIPVLPGLVFIQGDLNAESVQQQLAETIGAAGVDAVISDIAPNLSGNKTIDQPRVMQLVEMSWHLAQDWLQPGGFFLTKLFQGADVEEFMRLLRPQFKSIKWRKPAASRARSNELYLLAQGYRGQS